MMPTEFEYQIADEWLAPYRQFDSLIARERLAEAIAKVRNAALEQAAQHLESLDDDGRLDREDCANIIRALKDKP